MDQLNLERLPLNILHLLCDELLQLDTNKATLFAFSRVSKRCCESTWRLRFKSITVNIPNPHDLSNIETVTGCMDMLTRNNGFACVQRLTVHSDSPPRSNESRQPRPRHNRDKHPAFVAELRRQNEERARVGHRDRYISHGPRHDQMFHAPYHSRGTPSYEQVHSDKDKWNEKWEPVAKIITALDRLRDFVFDTDHAMLPVVLTALQRHHAKPRLHMLGFWLPSTSSIQYTSRKLSPEDLDVAFSPCLYSLTCAAQLRAQNFTLEAVQDVVIHTAPQLKHLWIHNPSGQRYPVEPNAKLALSSWSVSKPGSSSSWLVRDTAKLSGLHFTECQLYGADFAFWQRVVDFSSLRSLTMPAGFIANPYDESSSLPQLADLAPKLRSLEHVSLFVKQLRYHDDAAQFLKTVRPLSSITLFQVARAEPLQALAVHARTLTHLAITLDPSVSHDILSLDFVQNLKSYVPCLESLEIPVLRSRGNRKEVAFYHAIGSLPHLGRAVLTLHYNFVAASANTKREEVLEDALADAAVDEALARSIFKAMMPAGCAAEYKTLGIQYLRIEPRGHNVGGIPGDGEGVCERWVYRAVLRGMAQSWICDTSWSDGMSDGVSVRVAFEHVRMAHRLREVADANSDLANAWRRLWPCSDENLFETWSSFPLETK